MHPRLRSFLKGNGQALYFFRTTLVHLPGAEAGSGDGDSLGEVAVRPVLAKPQHEVEYPPKNKRKVTRKRDSKPGTPEKLGPRVPGFPDHCPNCFEINMNSVEKFIEDTRQIRDLTRNESGLAFTLPEMNLTFHSNHWKKKFPGWRYIWIVVACRNHGKIVLPKQCRQWIWGIRFLSGDCRPGQANLQNGVAQPERNRSHPDSPGRDPRNYILHRVIAEI